MISIYNRENSKFLEPETHIFPGGEIHIRVDPILKNCFVDIHATLRFSADILRLLLTVNALEHLNAHIGKLYIPYVPYARQDRVCKPGEALSIQVMADLINSIKAKKVIISDPHSDVAGALIKNCFIQDWKMLIPPEILINKTLVCPDAGAQKKFNKLGVEYILANKVRDLDTGCITTDFPNLSLSPSDTYLILDDICDGGNTFIQLAHAMKEAGARDIELYVTHGIFRNGLDFFKGYLSKIYTYQIGGKFECISIL